MNQFTSGRDALDDFDWKYYSEREDSDEEDEVFIAHSTPILIGSGDVGRVALEPRKDINLWKRRTMDPPKPLQLNGRGKP
ncbi:hypothetical protein IFM89_029857 [Coptis chinensis]|uniref:Uncharacterized protein n=1 Tax=Coptis chinensis TaxID=261450 RepID=A0A835LNU5_9MAGN|nr:hypothetical protein IFM89_029857 [Coptis chinensis]